MIVFVFVLIICGYSLKNPFDMENFDSGRLRYVRTGDHPSGNTHLFRGTYPGRNEGLTKKFYDYDILKENLALLSEENGLSFNKSDLYIIDINLIFQYLNVAEHVVAKKFWERNPDLGEFMYHPIIGSVVNATSLGKTLRDPILSLFEKWDYDNLHQRIPDLHNMINTDYGRTTVIYVHCSHGVDRTGEYIGAYKLQYMKAVFPEIVRENNEIKGKPTLLINRLMLGWYCYYLQSKRHDFDMKCDNWE